MSADIQATTGQKTWELSLYELHRQPQEVITDNTEIAVSPRSLHSELMCPICLDMLRNTMTTKECLHRFCHDCIITALRSGNKECPTCRKKLVSKRSLRPDPNFDMLISKIHPNREEIEAQQAKLLENITRKNQFAGLSLEESLRMQALSRATHHHKMRKMSSVESIGGSSNASRCSESPTNSIVHTSDITNENNNHATTNGGSTPVATTKVKKIKKSIDGGGDVSNHESSENTPSNTTTPFSPPEVELVFKPLPHNGVKDDRTPTQTRFIKTTTNATVEHLVKYLSMRHKLDGPKRVEGGQNGVTTNPSSQEDEEEPPESLFTLYLATGPGQYQPLDSSMTLEGIIDAYFSGKSLLPIPLFYAYKIEIAKCPVDPLPQKVEEPAITTTTLPSLHQSLLITTPQP